jgi:hypothetical protein
VARASIFIALALAASLAACEAPPGNADDTQQQLVGTWLREFGANGIQSRRVLVLEPGGAFHETVRVVDRSGKTTDFEHEGTWLFDGTNLKRRYTLMNGRPPSRLNVPFVTFEISFPARNEFVGVDHIHRNQVAYRRVSPETLP